MKLVTREPFFRFFGKRILIHTSVKLVTTSVLNLAIMSAIF